MCAVSFLQRLADLAVQAHAPRSRQLIALVIFFGGFEASERAISCSPSGFESGSGSGLLSGPYHYTCVNGKLTLYPGECNRGGATMDANGNVMSVSTC